MLELSHYEHEQLHFFTYFCCIVVVMESDYIVLYEEWGSVRPFVGEVGGAFVGCTCRHGKGESKKKRVIDRRRTIRFA